MSETQQDVVLQLSRRYDAPRERVFDAWTSPEVLKDWWAVQPTWTGEITDPEWTFPDLSADLVIDALYGAGLSRPLTGTDASLISIICDFHTCVCDSESRFGGGSAPDHRLRCSP